jgi:hypothetical protein
VSEERDRPVEGRAHEIEPAAERGEVEARSSLPVLAEARPIDRPIPSALPAVAAAAGGFLMGVATFVLVRILRRPRGTRIALGRRRKRDQALDIAGTRSFLVDIHLLKR